jgi:hypothetical protein
VSVPPYHFSIHLNQQLILYSKILIGVSGLLGCDAVLTSTESPRLTSVDRSATLCVSRFLRNSEPYFIIYLIHNNNN